MRRGGGLFAVAVALVTLSSACTRRASDKELEGWSEEVKREEEALRTKGVASEAASWTLSVRGNVEGTGAEYDWPRIVAMANTHVKTTCPTHTKDVDAVIDYRGVLFSDILKAVGARETDGPGGKDLTIVAADGFVISRPIAEMHRWPAILAIEEDGVPLVKNTGGPLLEILPHSSHPESKRIYPEGGAYYVTTLIVGTEKLAITAGGKTFHEKELGALPQQAIEGKHAFRCRWPSGEAKLYGPRLRDVLGAAGVKVEPSDRVLVRRRAHTDIPARAVMTLDGDDVLKCDIVLGLRHGDARALIPATLGGPAVIGVPSTCPNAARGQAWSTFVESLEVVPKGDGG